MARAPLATAIFVAAIAAVTFKLAALPVAVLGGAFLMLLTRCISPDEAYAQVEWKALILIGSLLSLGAAMESSGTGKYLAAQLIDVVGADGPYRAADVLLPAHGRPDAADVEPVGGRGGAADRHPDRRCSLASIRAALP